MIGQSLSRYTIEAKLGEGGMGVVYRARDTQLERTVAIKVLPPDQLADPDRKRRFIQEARAASALNHPAIVTIYDVGSERNTDFIVMEYVAGRTLDQVVPAGGLALKKGLRFAIEIADAVARAHEAGIIHRDLKPANVMVTDTGGIKILDFGIAKLLESTAPAVVTKTAAVTQDGTTVGTPAYMSPEQADGQRVDARSDVFSFGSVLYEMMTGRRAFSGDSRLSVMARILNEDPVPPGRLAATIPADLEKVILRCLRKDPARRFQTMADLRVALEDLALESSAPAPLSPAAAPSDASLSSTRSSTRRRWAAGVVLMAIVAGAYFVVQSLRTPPPAEPLRAVPLTSLAGVVRYPSLSPDGSHVVFSWTGPKQTNPDLYVQQIGTGSPLPLTTDPGNDYRPSWSPDGLQDRLPSSRSGPDQERSVADRPARRVGTKARRDRAADDRSIGPAPSDGAPIPTCVLVTDSPVANESDAVFAIALDGGEKRQLTFPKANVADLDPAISPDGRHLLFRRDGTPFSGEFHRVALKPGAIPDGDPVRLTTTIHAGTASWTPDSREILFAARGSLWRVDGIRGGTPARLPYIGQDGLTPVVSRLPDGSQRLVYIHSFSDTNIWRVDTSAAGVAATAPPAVAIASTRSDSIPNLSPDGRRVTFLSNRSGESEVWVAALDGSQATQVTFLALLPGFPRWAPNGNQIAFHGDPQNRADVLTVPAQGGTAVVVSAKNAGGGFPSFSRDGQWIYFASAEPPRNRIWKMPVSGGAPVRITDTVGAITVESNDGRDLFYVEAVERPSPVFRVPVSGGAAVKVLDGVSLGAFDVIEGGIYYIERVSGEAGAFFTDRPGGETRLQYFDFATQRSTTVAHNLGTIASGLSASRDGRIIIFSRVDSSVDELMQVDNFR